MIDINTFSWVVLLFRQPLQPNLLYSTLVKILFVCVLGHIELWLVRNTFLWLVNIFDFDRVNNLASNLAINYYNQFMCITAHNANTTQLLHGLHHHHHHGPSECHHHHHLAKCSNETCGTAMLAQLGYKN